MAGLEDKPKKFFTTPEDYFEKLSAKIQTRISEMEARRDRKFVFRYALRYAVPVLAVAAGILYYNSVEPDVETILASVETEVLIDYLQEAGMTTDEVLENIEFTDEELDAIENEVYEISFPETE